MPGRASPVDEHPVGVGPEPGSALDLVDQAGARKRLRSKGPHTDSRELERRLESLQRDKDQAVADEDYERAGTLRDQVAEATKALETARHERTSGQGGVLSVGVEDIAEVAIAVDVEAAAVAPAEETSDAA